MTSQSPQSQATTTETPNNKEINFRLQEKALKDKYERELSVERAERERLTKELEARNSPEDEDTEPYVDHKKLNKTLHKFGQQTQNDMQKAMEQAKFSAKEEIKREMWLENNPDFYEVLQHADKFAEKAPELAKSILTMPEGFERQKLVYNNIKTMGVHRPEVKQPSIQEKIDANRKSPYYQPSGISSAPYSSQSDFSPGGQKQAYDKMQDLKSRLRI